MFDFEYQLKMIPEKPGVYLMKDYLGEVIYVGKAKVLKNRVRQYFQKSRSHSEKVKAMVKNIAEFEYIITDSEMEALILECNLIKKYRPKYNILLKDDKQYPFIKITTNEDFPRVLMVRNLEKDGSKYFGPYPEYLIVYEIIDLIESIFPIRSCRKNIKSEDKKIRPCLNYQIGLCKAPCGGHIDKDEYNDIIVSVIDLMSGKDKDIVKKLENEMEHASDNLEFEKAADYRDKLRAVKKISEKQKIMTLNFANEDYINIFSDEKDTCAQVFFLRDGKVMGREDFILENTLDESKGNIIANFIKEFYGATAFIPKKIYVTTIDENERKLLEKWLSIKKGLKVEIKSPKIGDKKDFLNMIETNAKMTLEQFKSKYISDKEIYKETLLELSDILGLEQFPHRIEAYDISNIQGVDSVGSMVVFEDGKAKSSDYRRFKIKNVKGINDYDSMREIITRRFECGLEEIKSIQERNLNLSSGKFCVFPDLIMIDGGKGQVNVALDVLEKFNIKVPVCGMVKDDKHNTKGIIYNNTEIIMKQNSNIMKLIARIQNEAHRFAISYHRSLRNKRAFHSVLEDIPNIGSKRKKELLKKFGSMEDIKKASYEDLIKTPSMNVKAAESVISFFKDN